MAYYFTPVRGKHAVLNDWPDTELTKEEAKAFPKTTGIAIVHGQSGTCCIDIDDLEWVQERFEQIGINILELLKNHFRIKSPAPNRAKAVFKLPEGKQLDYISLPAGSKHCRMELRAGRHYDVWPGSEYPAGGVYSHEGNKVIQTIPDELLEFWELCMERKRKEASASPTNGGFVPLVDENGKMSVIHVFNVTYDLETTLIYAGYTQKNNKWKSPFSTSGSYGLTTQESYLNPWYVCYSHHASDGELANRPIDAFEIAASMRYPDKPVKDAKSIFTAEQSKKLRAIDPETGELLSISVDEYNRGALDAERDLIDLIDEPDGIHNTIAPEFKDKIISSLPAPFPMLLENFKAGIYDPVPAMYGPAFMALHEVLLMSKVKTVRGRSVNCNYANGSLSGGGKDDNSVEAARRYLEAVLKTGGMVDSSLAALTLQTLLQPITATFTSGNNMLQLLHSAKVIETDEQPLGGAVFNSEATSFFRMIADSKNPFMGNAMMDIEIACFNGMFVAASKVTTDKKKHIEEIKDPNFSFFRLTQLDPFKRIFNQSLVDKGYYGRMFETYDMREKQAYVPSGVYNTRVPVYDNTGFDFLIFLVLRLLETKQDMVVVCNDKEGAIRQWEQEVMAEMYQKMDPDLFVGVKRVPQIAEKWVATITTFCYYWSLFNEAEAKELVLERNSYNEPIILNGRPFEKFVVPMMNYLASVKWFTINNFIASSNASEFDAVVEEIWSSCVKLTRDKDVGKTYAPWLRKGLVPVQLFMDKVKKKRELLRLTDNDMQRIINMTNSWLYSKGLIISKPLEGESTKARKTCIIERY